MSDIYSTLDELSRDLEVVQSRVAELLSLLQSLITLSDKAEAGLLKEGIDKEVEELSERAIKLMEALGHKGEDMVDEVV